MRTLNIMVVATTVFFSTAIFANADDDYQTALEAAKYRAEKSFSDKAKYATNPTEKVDAERTLKAFQNMPEDVKDSLTKEAY